MRNGWRSSALKKPPRRPPSSPWRRPWRAAPAMSGSPSSCRSSSSSSNQSSPRGGGATQSPAPACSTGRGGGACFRILVRPRFETRRSANWDRAAAPSAVCGPGIGIRRFSGDRAGRREGLIQRSAKPPQVRAAAIRRSVERAAAVGDSLVGRTGGVRQWRYSTVVGFSFFGRSASGSWARVRP